jgi:type IV pilus biogenesis protein CpaD/CtpE
MNVFSRASLVVVAMLTLSMAACFDDTTTGTRDIDMTTPTIVYALSRDDHHVDVKFSEGMRAEEANNKANYAIVEGSPPVPSPEMQVSSPGDPVAIAGVGLQVDGSTVSITTETSIAGVSLKLTVSSLRDLSGNALLRPQVVYLTGSTEPETTPHP